MMYLPRSILLLLTASIPAITHAQFNTDNLIPEWLPQCFDGQQAVNPFEVVDCIQTNSNPTCAQFSFEDSMMTVLQCVNVTITEHLTQLVEAFAQQEDEIATSKQANGNGNNQDFLQGFFEDVMGMDPQELFNIGRVFVNQTLECLDPYAGCVQETIEQAMATQLQPCINQTLRDLVDCGQTNQDLCLESCSATAVTSTLDQALLEGLTFESVETCGGIQANVMNPLCEVVSCCEPCMAKVEALMQCIVNEQLDQVPAVGISNTCNELVCPAVPQRRQLRPTSNTPTTSSSRMRKLEHTAPEECLQFSPGLTGNDAKEFSARSTVFLPCVTDSFARAVQTPVVEQPVVVDNGAQEEVDSGVQQEDNSGVQQEGNNGVQQEDNGADEQQIDGADEPEDNGEAEPEDTMTEQETVNGAEELEVNGALESGAAVKGVGVAATLLAVASLLV